MDAKQTVCHLTQEKDEQLLLLHVYERMQTAMQRNIPAASGFLSERERMLAEKLLYGLPVTFFGGTDTAERRVCRHTPEYLEPDDGCIAAVRAEFFEKDPLSHRDFLGALMGAGIRRETVGDIYVGKGTCDFLVTREILPYVLQNLTSAGRTKLSLREISLAELTPPQVQVKSIRDTVSSLRLDSVVSVGFSLSRTRAAELIEAGRVELDHALCLKPDKPVAEGGLISIRGLGRAQLTEVGGTTKKGRLSVTVSRYL